MVIQAYLLMKSIKYTSEYKKKKSGNPEILHDIPTSISTKVEPGSRELNPR